MCLSRQGMPQDDFHSVNVNCNNTTCPLFVPDVVGEVQGHKDYDDPLIGRTSQFFLFFIGTSPMLLNRLGTSTSKKLILSFAPASRLQPMSFSVFVNSLWQMSFSRHNMIIVMYLIVNKLVCTFSVSHKISNPRNFPVMRLFLLLITKNTRSSSC